MAKKISELEMHQLNESKRFRDGERRFLEDEVCARWGNMPPRTIRRFRKEGRITPYKWGRTIGYHPRDVLRFEAECFGLRRDDDIEKYIQHELLPLMRKKPLWNDDDVFRAFGWTEIPRPRAKHLIEWARQNGLSSIKFTQKIQCYRECDVLAFDFKIKNQHAA